MIPTIVPALDEYRGDTWEGIDFGPLDFDGQPPPAALVSCRLYFRKALGGEFGYGFKSEVAEGFGRIWIIDAASWYVRIYPQELPLPAGQWAWDLECYDANGHTTTVYQGLLTIKKDITHDND